MTGQRSLLQASAQRIQWMLPWISKVRAAVLPAAVQFVDVLSDEREPCVQTRLQFRQGAASVWLQRKFYCYHWGITLPFIMLCAGYGLAVCMQYVPRLTAAFAIAIMIYGFVCSPAWYSNDKVTYQTVTRSFWEYTGGYRDRVSYLNQFLGGYAYYYQAEEIVGEMIRQRPQPGDRLLVRGFEPAIYAVSGLRSPSRFFIEIPFIDPFLRGYNTTTWPAEHERSCWTNPPRFVVAFARDRKDINKILSRGYKKICTVFILYCWKKWMRNSFHSELLYRSANHLHNAHSNKTCSRRGTDNNLLDRAGSIT